MELLTVLAGISSCVTGIGAALILLLRPVRDFATLDADDQSILYTPLFTYAANPDANKTISFGNYLAALYAEIVTNDPATGLPEGASVEAFAGGVTEPEYGEITRGDLMAALPATARIQLVSTTAEAARALADGGTVSRVYRNSLTEYAPRGCSLHRHRHGDSGRSGCGVHGPARLRRCLLECSDEHQRPDRQLYHRVCAAGGPQYGVGRRG